MPNEKNETGESIYLSMGVAGLGAFVLVKIFAPVVEKALEPTQLNLYQTAFVVGTVLLFTLIYALACLYCWMKIRRDERHIPTQVPDSKEQHQPGTSAPGSTPPPELQRQKSTRSMTRLAVASALVALIGSGAYYATLPLLFSAPPTPGPSETTLICLGQYRGKCPTDAKFYACGNELVDIRKQICPTSTSTQKTLLNVGGNQCGYVVAEITCND